MELNEYVTFIEADQELKDLKEIELDEYAGEEKQ